MSTEADKRRIEAQDPQPGTSTFDRNHPATWQRHDPMDKQTEQRAAAFRLRQRAPQIEEGDRLTARLMIEAAVLLDHATTAEAIWEARARHAEHRCTEMRHEMALRKKEKTDE